MIAQSYSFLADAHMGQAGTASSPRRKEFLNKALESINCAFAGHSSLRPSTNLSVHQLISIDRVLPCRRYQGTV